MKKLSDQSAEALDLVLEDGFTSKRARPVAVGVSMPQQDEFDEFSRLFALLALLDESTEGPTEGLAERTIDRIRRTPPPAARSDAAVLFPGS